MGTHQFTTVVFVSMCVLNDLGNHCHASFLLPYPKTNGSIMERKNNDNIWMRKINCFFNSTVCSLMDFYILYMGLLRKPRMFLIYVPYFSDKQGVAFPLTKGIELLGREPCRKLMGIFFFLLFPYDSCLLTQKVLDQRLPWAKYINILWYKSSPLPVSYLDITQKELLYLPTVSLSWWK